jgi:HEPN domain-containing protein
MEKVVSEWVEISEYDLKTAEAMLATARYLYVAFMCQQAIEKILKALYVQQKGELPPRTHNLLYIADMLEMNMEEDNKTWLSQLNQFYLESRYPDERVELAMSIDKQKAREILDKTTGVWQCLKQMLR